MANVTPPICHDQEMMRAPNQAMFVCNECGNTATDAEIEALFAKVSPEAPRPQKPGPAACYVCGELCTDTITILEQGRERHVWCTSEETIANLQAEADREYQRRKRLEAEPRHPNEPRGWIGRGGVHA